MHLSDLHLGKQLGDLSLLGDQVYILSQIVDIAEREAVDAVLISGDVYQRSAPQAEAMSVFDTFMRQLVAQNRKVIMISGNHDSELRLSYFSTLIRRAGVYAAETFDGALQSVSFIDNDGEIVVWMLPFIRPQQVRRMIPEAKITTYQDAVAAVIDSADIDTDKRNILLCHQFITGSETSDSEELAVGGLENVDASVFDAFDYVALGHIHKPQRVLRDTLRYAGSPLKYSFSEANHIKSVTIVDLQEKGYVSVHNVPLHPLHNVRLIEGMMKDVLRLPYSEDYVWITIHDEIVPPDVKVRLSIIFPNMLKFSVVNSRTKYDLDVQAVGQMESKSVAELFSDFYRLQNNDQLPGEKHMKVLDKIIREMEEEPHETT